MTYNCQSCGAPFSASLIRETIKSKDPFIICPYCNSKNDFQSVKSSHAARGHEYLAMGDFYRASYAFSTAIDDAKHHNRHPGADTYLGYAMAQFRVQPVFSDDDEEQLEFPTLICHKCNEMYFSDSEPFLNAMRSIEDLDISIQATERAKINKYADYIDSIKDNYDRIKKSKGNNFKYNVFIAYEDMPDDPGNRGYEFADKVRNSLPDKINKIFVPDREEYGSEEEYEAAILYAMENTNCMLVITDNDIDSRLINIYSRYYYIAREQRKAGSSLGFVRYCGHITISLPDKTIEKQNVFDIENKSEYCHFVTSKNGIVVINNDTETPELPETPISEPDDIDFDFGDETGAPVMMEGNLIAFGSYPQRLCRDLTVQEHFSSTEIPSSADSCGWSILSYTRKGKPHMWYLDREYNNKKYRLVYFTRYRDLYSVQDSDVENISQQMNGYVKRTIYCFEFEPLVWNIKSISNDVAVLVSSHGIDSREYNSKELTNDWQGSTIHTWLNEEFLKTAFTEDELEYLGMLDSEDENDKVYLVDKSFDREYYHNSCLSITGSDYYKCIGGMGDSIINNYWITANINTSDEEAMVVYPQSKNEIATQYVDCSGVAVLPKIVIKFNK